MNIRPRGTFILVRLVLKSDEQIGNIVIPTDSNEYAEGEVLSVGPGRVDAAGGDTGVEDLTSGQRVLVKHKRKVQRGPDSYSLLDDGLEVRPQDSDQKDVYLFDETNIIAILGDIE